MGIACKLAKEYECFPCDSVMIVGNNWGDESGRFLDKIEELFCYGGGDQTKNEAHKAKQLGVEVYSRHLKEIPK